MKFLVDELPYYKDFCPFDGYVNGMTCGASGTECCPRYWPKELVCSDDNPHECEMFIEVNINDIKTK